MTGLTAVRPSYKPRARTGVGFRASSQAEVSSGSSVPIVIPATAVTGDFVLFGLTVAGGAAVTPPAGVTLIDAFEAGNPSATLYIYSRVIGAGDPGATLTWTKTGGQAATLVCGVYSNCGGIGSTATRYMSITPEMQNARPPRIPLVRAGVGAYMVSIVAAYGNNTNPEAAKASAAVSGMTLREAVSAQDTALAFPRGTSLMDAPGPRNNPADTYTMNIAAAHNGGVTMALVPANPRWAETERVPSTLAGKRVIVYSTSSNAYQKRPEANWGYNSRWVWGDRINRALGANANSKNYALAGAKSSDICTALFGSHTFGTQAPQLDQLQVQQVVHWTPQDALVLTDLIGNDIVSGGVTTQRQNSVRNACRSILRRLRAGTINSATHASVSVTGTWTNPTSDGTTGGSYRLTTVPGSVLSFTVTDTPAVDVVLLAEDTPGGVNGSSYEVKVDGVVVSSGTVHNQMMNSGWAQDPGYEFCQLTIPVTGIPAGSHTISVTHTGVSGERLGFDSWQVPSATPPWIVTNHLPRSDNAMTTYGYTWADQQLLTQILLDIVATDFTDGRVVVYNPSESGVLDPATYLCSDYLHQTEIGMAHYAHEILRALVERVP